MIKIRKSVFETNSSMTHSLVLLNDKDYVSWKNNELYIDFYTGKLYTTEEVEAIMIHKFGHDLRDYPDIEAFDRQVVYDMDAFCLRYYDNKIDGWFETYDASYVIDGKSIHAIGYYGHD